MDPLSISASISALGAASHAAIKGARKLQRYSKDVRTARKDINEFRKTVHIYGSLMGAARNQLRRYFPEQLEQAGPLELPESQVLQDLGRNHVFEMLAESSLYVTDELRSFIPVIGGLSEVNKMIIWLKWPLRKKKIQAISPKMDTVRSYVQLVISMVTLEETKSGPQTRETRELIQQLRQDIKLHVETIRFQRQVIEAQFARHDDNFAFLNLEIGETLQDCGATLVQQTRVHRSRASRSRRNSSSTSRMPRQQQYRSESSPPPAPVSAVTIQEVNTHQSRSQERSIRPPPPPETHRPPSPTSIIRPPPIRIAEPESSRSHQDSPTEIASASYHREGDFVGVEGSSNLIQLDHSLEFIEERGYITTTSGPREVTAQLYETLSDNLISQAFVIENDIEIQSLGDREIRWMEVGGVNEVLCVGSVRIQWSSNGQLPFPVHCLVFPLNQGHGDLVFGKPFLKKKRHYMKVK